MVDYFNDRKYFFRNFSINVFKDLMVSVNCTKHDDRSVTEQNSAWCPWALRGRAQLLYCWLSAVTKIRVKVSLDDLKKKMDAKNIGSYSAMQLKRIRNVLTEVTKYTHLKIKTNNVKMKCAESPTSSVWHLRSWTNSPHQHQTGNIEIQQAVCIEI